MATHQMQVFGAWLYKGKWDSVTPPPMEGWKLLRMVPGRHATPPFGMTPRKGQVLLLMHGEKAEVVTPEEE